MEGFYTKNMCGPRAPLPGSNLSWTLCQQQSHWPRLPPQRLSWCVRPGRKGKAASRLPQAARLSLCRNLPDADCVVQHLSKSILFFCKRKFLRHSPVPKSPVLKTFISTEAEYQSRNNFDSNSGNRLLNPSRWWATGRLKKLSHSWFCGLCELHAFKGCRHSFASYVGFAMRVFLFQNWGFG